MAVEIPGSLILGNGDLNGILWHHNGQLRFSITKNDACDGRLETVAGPGAGPHRRCQPPMDHARWLPGSAVVEPSVSVSVDLRACRFAAVKTRLGGASRATMPKLRFASMPTPNRSSRPSPANPATAPVGDSCRRFAGEAHKVTAKFSGSANAKWYLDFPGTGLKSGWQPAKPDATEVEFEIPANKEIDES